MAHISFNKIDSREAIANIHWKATQNAEGCAHDDSTAGCGICYCGGMPSHSPNPGKAIPAHRRNRTT